MAAFLCDCALLECSFRGKNKDSKLWSHFWAVVQLNNKKLNICFLYPYKSFQYPCFSCYFRKLVVFVRIIPTPTVARKNVLKIFLKAVRHCISSLLSLVSCMKNYEVLKSNQIITEVFFTPFSTQLCVLKPYNLFNRFQNPIYFNTSIFFIWLIIILSYKAVSQTQICW